MLKAGRRLDIQVRGLTVAHAPSSSVLQVEAPCAGLQGVAQHEVMAASSRVCGESHPRSRIGAAECGHGPVQEGPQDGAPTAGKNLLQLESAIPGNQ